MRVERLLRGREKEFEKERGAREGETDVGETNKEEENDRKSERGGLMAPIYR